MERPAKRQAIRSSSSANFSISLPIAKKPRFCSLCAYPAIASIPTVDSLVKKGEFSCFCCPFTLKINKRIGEKSTDFLYMVLKHLSKHTNVMQEVNLIEEVLLKPESVGNAKRLTPLEWERTGIFNE
jgi:hypothetical protein